MMSFNFAFLFLVWRLLSFLPQLLFDDPDGFAGGERGDRVAKFLEFDEKDGRKNVRPDGQGLPELDEGRAQLGQRFPQLDGVLSLEALVVQNLSPANENRK
jgi:hypothetical protein